MFRREIIQAIDLKEERFGFEPEVTAKLAETRCRLYEVGISYSGRTYEEGKKIGWRDGFRAVWCILKYRPRRRTAAVAVPARQTTPPRPPAEPARDTTAVQRVGALSASERIH
jgi:hypothetical protein